MEEKQINNEMVILARESRGYTQKDLADKLRITQSALSRVEGGLRGLTPATLRRLSEALNYPESFFTQRRKIYGVGLTEVFHRKRRCVSNRLLNKIYALIDIRTNEIARLLKSVETGTIDILPINVNDYDGNAKEVARIVRASWNMPHGPIQNLTAIIEHAGGIVVPFDFETSDIDAISHWLPGLPPIFFVNKFCPADRLRFTLAHELGHVIMHQKTPDPFIEEQANEFAAEFLMPEKDIKPYLVDISLDKLASLKPYWKVSMAALLKRAIDLKVISYRRGTTLWTEISRAGYRIREPMNLDILVENPTLLKEIVRVYTHKMNYSIPELAHLLVLKQNEMQDIYFDKQEEIRSAIAEAESILKSK
jgi:Zn-dependent peptidase ImmA (M78 family)/transcriptional regulator with XRE-family HTH domain